MNPYSPNKYTYTYIVKNSVVLKADPVTGKGMATKQYLTTRLSSIPITSLTGSTPFPAATMPSGLTGDLTTSVGSPSTLTLASGVIAIPGTYNVVTIDIRGRITAAAALTTSRLSGIISYNKITSGKPTTLSGYGITDAFSATTLVMTGPLLLSYTVSNPTELATKGYIDTVISALSVPKPVGDIYIKPVVASYTNHLRANGGALSKTTYATLYTLLGDRYTITSTPGNGRPWQLQYAFNTEQSTDITGWQTNGALPAPAYVAQIVATANRVYVLGGISTSDTRVSTVYTAPIQPDGTIGTWTTGTALPALLNPSHLVVTKSRVYLLGGYINITRTANVYYAAINTDGTLGTWTTGTAMPAALYSGQAIITSNRIYILSAIFKGGKNDYSSYYDGTTRAAYTTEFSLPDFSSIEKSGSYYYIKSA